MPQGTLRGWSLRNLSARFRGPLRSETSDVLSLPVLTDDLIVLWSQFECNPQNILRCCDAKKGPSSTSAPPPTRQEVVDFAVIDTAKLAFRGQNPSTHEFEVKVDQRLCPKRVWAEFGGRRDCPICPPLLYLAPALSQPLALAFKRMLRPLDLRVVCNSAARPTIGLKGWDVEGIQHARFVGWQGRGQDRGLERGGEWLPKLGGKAIREAAPRKGEGRTRSQDRVLRRPRVRVVERLAQILRLKTPRYGRLRDKVVGPDMSYKVDSDPKTQPLKHYHQQ
ncbi:hypothetical protein B0H19DRAFT_1081641 [Mycena capillaripes]|nr:hypothetical protein B0H19DRAFT_1081641 [Mycena capillaripes]